MPLTATVANTKDPRSIATQAGGQELSSLPTTARM
jgi:hypothetical protein